MNEKWLLEMWYKNGFYVKESFNDIIIVYSSLIFLKNVWVFKYYRLFINIDMIKLKKKYLCCRY